MNEAMACVGPQCYWGGGGEELEYMKDTMQNESKNLVLGHNVYK